MKLLLLFSMVAAGIGMSWREFEERIEIAALREESSARSLDFSQIEGIEGSSSFKEAIRNALELIKEQPESGALRMLDHLLHTSERTGSFGKWIIKPYKKLLINLLKQRRVVPRIPFVPSESTNAKDRRFTFFVFATYYKAEDCAAPFLSWNKHTFDSLNSWRVLKLLDSSVHFSLTEKFTMVDGILKKRVPHGIHTALTRESWESCSQEFDANVIKRFLKVTGSADAVYADRLVHMNPKAWTKEFGEIFKVAWEKWTDKFYTGSTLLPYNALRGAFPLVSVLSRHLENDKYGSPLRALIDSILPIALVAADDQPFLDTLSALLKGPLPKDHVMLHIASTLELALSEPFQNLESFKNRIRYQLTLMVPALVAQEVERAEIPSEVKKKCIEAIEAVFATEGNFKAFVFVMLEARDVLVNTDKFLAVALLSIANNDQSLAAGIAGALTLPLPIGKIKGGPLSTDQQTVLANHKNNMVAETLQQAVTGFSEWSDMRTFIIQNLRQLLPPKSLN